MTAPSPAPQLDVESVSLSGTTAIEASAGTGKTHTITQLYLRLVVESGLPVESILVVTYTVAATEELRARIRDVLARARTRISRRRYDDDTLLPALVDRTGEVEALRRVEAALRSFDESSIFTIHGFCQRVLAEKAFESAMPFRTELLADESDLLAEIAEDFWRRHVYDAPPLLAAYLVDRGATPAALLESIRDFVGKTYVKVLAPPPASDTTELEDQHRVAWTRARACWLGERAAVERLLVGGDALKRGSYSLAKIPGWLEELDAFFEEGRPGLDAPDCLAKLTAEAIAGATRAGRPMPSHPFFAACSELRVSHERLRAGFEGIVKSLRVELLDFCRRELGERKRRLRVQSYDDLLGNLAGALDRDRSGRLAEAIRERWRAALIDEFQDTDPIQYRIFDAIYRGSGRPVFFVGDPKQAIYSFRGADIFAYLEAKDRADRRFPLGRNWRSDPGLVTAVNTLFEGARRPMLFEQIVFQPAEPAEREREPFVVEGDPPEPFVLRVLRRTDGAGVDGAGAGAGKRQAPVSKRLAREVAARSTAAEIARLLNLGARGRARIGDRPLAGGDVAVLVRTNREAKLVRRALLEARVPSVQRGMESVFATREALELERVLAAIATPGDESRFKAALATEMLGVPGERLWELQEPGGEPEWEERAGRMRVYHQAWRDQGFVRMFRAMLVEEGVAARLLAYPDGERRTTNLRHLGELLAEAEVGRRLGIESLLRWLADRRHSASEESDEHIEAQQLRLESDDDLVQIVTVHKSKGLEYGVVFCPFLWDGRVWVAASESRDKPFLFHDPESYAPTADFGSEQAEQMRAQAVREEIAEKLRLLYVALTRARHRCVLYCGAINEAATSAPTWLLHQGAAAGALATPDEVAKRFEALGDDAALLADLRAVAARSDGTIRVEDVDPDRAEVHRPPAAGDGGLRARALARPLPEAHRVASFSSLVARHDEGVRPHRPGRAGRLDADTPDHDGRAVAPPAPQDATGERTIFTFPRGVRAGSCLHEIFEELDFAAFGPAGREPAPLEAIAAIRPVVERKLATHRFEPEWQPVLTEAVRRAVALPLDAAGSVRLAGLSPSRCARELEFHYPVGGLDVADLRAVLLEHGVAGGRFAPEIETLAFPRVEGFMKGFIDLVFEAGGRFYVLDYKSNHLGDRPDDYAPERIAAAIARDGYYLQYLIYGLTLHRMLRLRLPDYDPARHLGGAFYVFLRGLDESRGRGWSVFHDRPSPALVESLDRLVAGDAAPPAPARAARRRRRS